MHHHSMIFCPYSAHMHASQAKSRRWVESSRVESSSSVRRLSQWIGLDWTGPPPTFWGGASNARRSKRPDRAVRAAKSKERGMELKNGRPAVKAASAVLRPITSTGWLAGWHSAFAHSLTCSHPLSSPSPPLPLPTPHTSDPCLPAYRLWLTGRLPLTPPPSVVTR